MPNLEDTNRGCRISARKTRAWPTTDPTKTCSDHPLRSTDSPSPHDFIVIWYKLEPSHVLSQDTLVTAAHCVTQPLPISRVLPSAVIPRLEHRLYSAVGLRLYYRTVGTALCAAVISIRILQCGVLSIYWADTV